MKNYRIDLTCIYNGSMVVEAETEEEALQIAQESLNDKTLKEFPDYVELPNGGFQFGEATADDVYEEE